jgi:hypothetical protein
MYLTSTGRDNSRVAPHTVNILPHAYNVGIQRRGSALILVMPSGQTARDVLEAPVNKEKSKAEIDKQLNEALEETFPGSDAIAVDRQSGDVVRPLGRKPPIIDKQLVEKLAEEAKAKKN